MTDAELRLVASAALMGESSQPVRVIGRRRRKALVCDLSSQRKAAITKTFA